MLILDRASSCEAEFGDAAGSLRRVGVAVVVLGRRTCAAPAASADAVVGGAQRNLLVRGCRLKLLMVYGGMLEVVRGSRSEKSSSSHWPLRQVVRCQNA